MKKSSILFLLTAGLFAQQSAVAEVPFFPWLVGQLDETITFCTNAKPAQASALKQATAKFFLMLPATDVAAYRKSKDYQKARAQAKESLSELDKGAVNRLCTLPTK
jgi:hypothetical protein